MKHTLKLFYRNFGKHFTINLINLGGLSLSMAVVLMLSAYCYSELTTDRHHKHAKETFLVARGDKNKSLSIHSPAILTDQLRSEIPEIQDIVRFSDSWETTIIKAEGREAFETELLFIDEAFFKIFEYNEIRGNLDIALSQPMSIVLTKPEALRLFGEVDVVGKTIHINNEHLVKVTAVIQAPAYNSCLSFKALMPTSGRPIIRPNGDEFTNWEKSNFQTFVHITEGADLGKIETMIKGIYTKNSSLEANTREIALIPLDKIYFSKINYPGVNHIKTIDLSKITILMIVALLILVIALINFVNISSYSLKERLRQTGIFKIIGANQRQILINILFESTLLFACSYWIAIMLIEVIHTTISRYTGISYINELTLTPFFIFVTFTTAISLGIITNIIPSVRHVFTHPVQGLKNEYNEKKAVGSYQGYLVIFQFCAAIVLITFTILVQKQINYGINGLGFHDENIVAIKLSDQINAQVFKDKLSYLIGIEKISLTQFYPNKTSENWYASIPVNGEDKNMQFAIFDADAAFMEIMGLELVSGRFYSDTTGSEKNKILINESFVKQLSIDNPLDLSFSIFSYDFEVVGVIKDFHYQSKNHAIGPLVIYNTGHPSYCLVQVSSNQFSDLSENINQIKAIARQLSPDNPVEVGFMEDAVEQMYQSEIQFRRTFTFFAGCAIFLSCLGILALSLFAGQQRTKEIGIRKVNGAHMEDILMLLNKDFIKWVLIAFVIASPLAWFAMNRWLEGFAYKTEISWWIFMTGGGMALLIALVTVSWQSWLAARRNPVDALRDE